MAEEGRGLIGEFIRKWIFHILLVTLGGLALFSKPEYDHYLAFLIFLVTLLWILRNLFFRANR